MSNSSSSTPPSAAMEPRTYTEREVITRERAAFVNGAMESHNFASEAGATKGAARLYPLPKVERPRVVQFNDTEWCIVNGTLRFRPWFKGGHYEWSQWMDFRTDPRTSPLKDLVAVWAELFANPTEWVDGVDADGAET